jgi:hypothetical protein
MVASLNEKATRVKEAAATKIELFDLSDATFAEEIGATYAINCGGYIWLAISWILDLYHIAPKLIRPQQKSLPLLTKCGCPDWKCDVWGCLFEIRALCDQPRRCLPQLPHAPQRSVGSAAYVAS